VSTLWPSNAILLGALLLAPDRMWLTIIAAALPSHLLVELGSGVPLPMVLLWFVSNCTEALIGALSIRSLIERPVRLDVVRNVGIVVLFGSLVGPFLSSFLDSAFVALMGWGSAGYWDNWRTRFFSNVLASLTLVPVILTWGNARLSNFTSASFGRAFEAALLGGGLLFVCTMVFTDRGAGFQGMAAVVYAPLPFLLWAAVRFGPSGASVSLLALTLISTWGAVHGAGPFVGRSVGSSVLGLQLFLIANFIPVLMLTAVIRALRNAEDEARGSAQQLQLALNAARMGTWQLDIDTGRAALSEELRHIFGLPERYREISLRMFRERIVSREDRPRVKEAFDRALEYDEPYDVEYRVDGAAGSTQWLHGKATVFRDEIGRPIRMIGVTADITDRKAAEAALRNEIALRESESRLRELANAMPQVVWTARPDGRIEYFNRKWHELTGTSGGSELTWFDVIHPLDRRAHLDAWRASIVSGSPYEHESRFWSAPHSAYRWHLARALPVRDASGGIAHWYGTATDIDDRKRTEEALRKSEGELRALSEALEQRVAERAGQLSSSNAALREEIDVRLRTEAALRASEERFGKAFRASLDAVAIVRRSDGRIIELNDRWETMFGYTRIESVGFTIDELGIYASSDEAHRLTERINDQGFVMEFELELRSKSKDLLYAVVAAAAVEVGDDPCLIIMVRDITGRRQAEHEVAVQRRALAHLGRVAVIGELSGALAHELNQPLTAILANARAAQQMLRQATIDGAGVREILDDIVSDGLRAGAVIHRVRGLIRSSDTRRQIIGLNDVANEVIELAHSDLIQRGVTLSVDLCGGLQPISADRVQIQQVMLNLIVNACDAMVDNDPADRILSIASADENNAVRISVTDRGPGIQKHSIDAVFEPFVTSKQNGLGLGLSICRSIINSHAGRIWAENNPDRGATFHVVLPRAPHVDESPIEATLPVLRSPALAAVGTMTAATDAAASR
jgi:PAS domain S-box-containing protein